MATCTANTDDKDIITDPGAAPYGNFINYYSFNPPEERLRLIPASLLQDLRLKEDHGDTLILDVGCNSGDLSVALYKHLVQEPACAEDSESSKVHILGFDLDETLIQRAQQSNPLPDFLSFIPLDVTEDTQQLQDYLRQHDSSHFHLCVCLAVTMWVHLNHGDSGLLKMLSHLASISQHLLLEVQPWKCYRSAARRLRKLGRSDFEHFKTLKIQGDIAEHVREHLEKHCSMELVQVFGCTTWSRKLVLFKKRN